MSETLAATVSLVAHCTPVVAAGYPWAELDEPDPSVFASIVCLDETCAAAAAGPLLQWIEGMRKHSRFPKVLVVMGNLPDPESVRIQQQLLTRGAIQILERPLNFQQLRYQIESARIEFDFWLKQQAPAVQPVASVAVADIHKQMTRVARVDTTVLLTGETGVGKTWWASQIHEHSRRADHPFVVVNCGNFTDSLVESQLFGHEAGAFTGADRQQPGQFSAADRGTIFLDEVDSLPLEIQARLLRVVENREFCPVGSVKPVKMKARVIAAANRDLPKLVDQGEFRKDLFYRLAAYQISIPPLRERRDEIPALCRHFTAGFARENGCPEVTFADDALQVLGNYAWPGNLRELRNVVERASIDCEGPVVQAADLTPELLQAAMANVPMAEEHPTAAGDSSASEAGRLVRALAKHNNNRSKAARELGVSRMTLYNLLHRYQLM